MKFTGLTYLALGAISLILWLNFGCLQIHDYAPDDGLKIENILEALCYAYVGSYIFYVFNVYMVERREKRAILPFISSKVISIVVNNQSIIGCLKNNPQLSLDDLPKQDEFKELLKAVNPKENAPFYIQSESWIYLFQNRQRSTKDSIQVMFQSGSKHIDEELRGILLELNNSLYLKEDYAFNSYSFGESDLSKYYLVFYKYFKQIQKLRTYYESNLKKYYMYRLDGKC